MFFTKPTWDALIVVLILLLFFGPKRLPGLGKSLGQGMREFKESISGKSNESEDEQPQLQQAASPPSSNSEPAQPAGVSAPAQPDQSQGASEPRP
jgi:sec-independent protein translocase protein TatA